MFAFEVDFSLLMPAAELSRNEIHGILWFNLPFIALFGSVFSGSLIL
jgi:hypothetical protein